MSLLPYCTSARERTVIQMTEQGIKVKTIAEHLGVNRHTVTNTRKRVESRATIQGYNPEFNMTIPVPNEYYVKGTSTLYKDGVKKLEWIKTNVKAEELSQIAKAIVESIKEDIPTYDSVEYAGNVPETPDYTDLIPFINIGDAHIGMLANAQETAENFDVRTAERELMTAFKTLLLRIPKTERIVLNDLGDFTHYETLAATTEASGHQLDFDTRYFRMIRSYVRLMRFMVDALIQEYKYVDVIINQGNHSRSNDIFMHAALSEMYKNEPRITVLDNASVFIPYRMGNTFVMTSHGDKAKWPKLADVMVADYAKDFGETTYRYIDTGHIHHNQVRNEMAGIVIESFNQLSASDKYAHDYGWRSRKAITCVIRSKTYGEVGRLLLSREEVQDIISGCIGSFKQHQKTVYTVA